MPKPNLAARIKLFTDSETAGGTKPGDLTKALRAAAKSIDAGNKTPDRSDDRTADDPPGGDGKTPPAT